MKRRDFMRGALPMIAAPLALGGVPVRAMAESLMTSSFTCEEVGDRVLVIIQLSGGNDGINTFVPLDQYNTYRNLRPRIGIDNVGVRKYIDLDTTLPSNQQIGLHPDLGGFKNLYDQGKLKVVQNVAYPNINGSHFRGTDIWLSGKDGPSMVENPDSGWFGRYLDHRFTNYPDQYPSTDMPDPPGLEFGSHIVSLGFHRAMGIPMGITLSNNPSNFAAQVNGLGGALPDTFPDSDYGRELEFITDVERTTNVYAQRLTDVYNLGANSPNVTYPMTYHSNASRFQNNPLSPQLRTVARLLAGGIKTKVFLVRMGGFDTHENQALMNKPSFGGHGTLLYHLSEAVNAFMEDLKGLGLDDRVIGLTFSEFGRQVGENGTFGTDHGTSAPMVVFGKGVDGGVLGDNPDIVNINRNRLVGFEWDYRQILSSVMMDWFGVNYGTLDVMEFYDHAVNLPDLVNSNFIDDQGNTVDFKADPACDLTVDLPAPTGGGGGGGGGPTNIDLFPEGQALNLWPNPASALMKLRLESESMQPATAGIFDLNGKLVKEISLRLFNGENTLELDVSDVKEGTYILHLMANHGNSFSAKRLGYAKFVISR
ncbi:MAG: DUF1501 domain-containing protein [Bacteroidia bacterium]|nr:DUF1501 domain-containing protein [Bacteroidia bacterium]